MDSKIWIFYRFNGFYSYICTWILSIPGRKQVRLYVFTYVVYLNTEYVHDTFLFESTVYIPVPNTQVLFLLYSISCCRGGEGDWERIDVVYEWLGTCGCEWVFGYMWVWMSVWIRVGRGSSGWGRVCSCKWSREWMSVSKWLRKCVCLRKWWSCTECVRVVGLVLECDRVLWTWSREFTFFSTRPRIFFTLPTWCFSPKMVAEYMVLRLRSTLSLRSRMFCRPFSGCVSHFSRHEDYQGLVWVS